MKQDKKIFHSSFASAINLFSILGFVFLYLPIFVLIVFSFNSSRLATNWEGFSLMWYEKALQNQIVLDAFANSLWIGIISAILSTVLGTSLAIAMERYVFRFPKTLQALVTLPILVPEIVMAIGLLFFFSRIVRPLFDMVGFDIGSIPAITAGHVAFNLSYVVVVVGARLKGIDPSLEEAALNLGASPFQVLKRVTIPILKPAIYSGALLSFTLSLDDFYISYFSSAGGSGFRTLPLHLFALQTKSGMSPEMNVIATLMLVLSIVCVSVAMRINRTR